MYRLAVTFVFCFIQATSNAGDWSQFRGPNATGLPTDDRPLPDEIGPEKNVVWKTALPPGHSSPIIVGDRIFLTAIKEQKLYTLGLDRATGKILWQREAPSERLETVHRVGSLATATPASDGKIVVSFFGSYGLLCHDLDGREQWRLPLGPFKNDFGMGGSPIIVEKLVLLCLDDDIQSRMIAVDRASGKLVWETPRLDASRNYVTPVVWNRGGNKQIVTVGTLRITAYDFGSGNELWSVPGIARMVCMTPVVSGDRLIAAGYSAGGDEGERIVVDPYDRIFRETDTDGDGGFSEAELPKGPVKQRFTQADRDKDGVISKTEYERFRRLFDQSENVILSLSAGEANETGEPRTTWKFGKFVPFCSSPIVVGETVFGCKDGGILASLDVETGKLHKAARAPGTDDYYASLVAGDGKVYLVNEIGKLTVVSAEPQWKVLSTAEFGENVYATPAVADGRLYLRTVGHLYCFGK